MHIHPSSPNSEFDPVLRTEESAAIKIQAGFRGYRVRKQLQGQTRDTSRGQQNHQNHAYQNSSQRPRNVNNNTSARTEFIGNNRSNSGNLRSQPLQARNEMGNGLTDGASVADRCATKIQAGVRGFLVRKKQKIAADAATKIQASFRGFKARKETQRLKQK